MKRLILALLAAWFAAALPLQHAEAAGAPAKAAVVLGGQKSIYPGASVALDFVGQACAGQPRCFKAGGVTTTTFASLPGVTISRASGGYAEDQTGALTWFNSGQARITNKGVLVEPAATNLVQQSQTFSGNWTITSSASVTANNLTAPDGTLTGSTLNYGSTPSSRIASPNALTLASGTTYAVSVYLRGGTSARSQIGIYDGASNLWLCSITWSGGVPTAAGGAGISNAASTPVVGGWYRITFNVTGTGSAFNMLLYPDATGAGGNIGIWGADVEVGSGPTSYIPTTSGTATRTADIITLPTGAAGATWTLAARGLLAPGQDGTQVDMLSWADSGISTANRALLIKTNNNTMIPFASTNGITTFNPSAMPGYASPRALAAAMSYDGAQYHAAAGGVLYGATTATGIAGMNTLYLGAANTGGVSWNGFIQTVVIYPQGVGDAGMQSLTLGVDASSLNLNFTSGSYRLPGMSSATTNFMALPGVSVSRAAPAYASDCTGKLVLFGSNVPRITCAGLLVEEARTNKSTNTNVNPASVTGVGLSGDPAAVLSVVDDSANLAAIGLGGNVYKLDNSAGVAVAVAGLPGVTGNTNPHVVSAYVRGAGSASVYLSNSAVAGSALPSSYTRLTRPVTPSAGTNTMQIRAEPGAVVYFILNDLEEGAFATSPIAVNGAAATRPADAIILSGLSIPVSAMTFAGQGVWPANTAFGGRLARLSDGTNSLELSSDTSVGKMAVVGSGLTTSEPGPAYTTGQVATLVESLAAGSVRASAGGGAVLASPGTATIGTATSLRVGDADGTRPWDGNVQQIRVYPYAANDNEAVFRSAGNW